MQNKIKCDVYSRCVGYFSTTDQWNKGKKEELRQRKMLKFSLAEQKEPIQAASHTA